MILGAGATYYETQIAGPKAKVAAKKQAGKRKKIAKKKAVKKVAAKPAKNAVTARKKPTVVSTTKKSTRVVNSVSVVTNANATRAAIQRAVAEQVRIDRR